MYLVTPVNNIGNKAPSIVVELPHGSKKQDVANNARNLSGLGRFKSWDFDKFIKRLYIKDTIIKNRNRNKNKNNE